MSYLHELTLERGAYLEFKRLCVILSQISNPEKFKYHLVCEHVCLSHVLRTFSIKGALTVTGTISDGFIWVTHTVFIICPCTHEISTFPHHPQSGVNVTACKHLDLTRLLSATVVAAQ